MPNITFYPLGDADCCKIDLANGRKLLFDFAHCKDSEDEDDLRIDLAEALRKDLESAHRDYFDVVAFTHGDMDHIRGSSEFFYLEHAKKYQSDERIRIKELWVPAAMIIEEGSKEESRILRSEARYRLKQGTGIRVFSRPEKLKNWMENEGISLEDHAHLITDAGNLVPGFTKYSDGAEFFVHSPFAIRENDKLIDRNEGALILQAVFDCDGRETSFMIIGDTTYEVLADIVNITRYHERDERLRWDIYDIPHHCSYLALSDEKGDRKTEPVEEVKWLLRQGQKGGILVSSSKPIPDGYEDDQPPQRQAANYYKELASNIDGEFRVTMEYPEKSNPSPIEIKIDGFGLTLAKAVAAGSSYIVSRSAPRAG